MMIVLKVVLCLTIAAGLTYLSTGQVLHSRQERAISNGAWRTDPTTGSAAAGLYHKARIATFGLWALTSEEVVYFTASTDSAGEPLRRSCTYRIEGQDPDTRWWSVTAYRDDHFIANPLNRYSFSRTTVQRNPAGAWSIRASAKEQPANWLPLGDRDGQMVFSLRCYNPSDALRQNPGSATLPRIVKETCE